VFGKDANDESRKAFVKLMQQEARIWAMALNIMDVGLLQPVTLVQAGVGEYAIQDGHRRYLASVLAYVMEPERAGADEIRAEISQATDAGGRLASACSANAHRKDLNHVEIGKNVARLVNDFGMSYKDAAARLNLFTPPKKGKPPVANQQYARNTALLHNSKISDEERAKVASGNLAYTKLLITKGLMKKTAAATDGAEATPETAGKPRKRSKTLSELATILDDRKALDKIVESVNEKKLDTFEAVRFVLAKAANIRYKAIKEAKVEEAESDEDAA